jgi:TonB family protein
VSARGIRMSHQPMLRPDLPGISSSSGENVPPPDVNSPRSEKPRITYDLPYLAAIFAEHGGGTSSAELALDVILNEIVEQARLATVASIAVIALIRGEEMVCRATAGINAPELGVRLDTASGLSGACVKAKELQMCSDTQTDERVEAEACRRIGVRSILVLPLLDQEKLIGVFEILSPRPNAFGEREVQTLRALVSRIIHSTHEASEAAVMIALENGACSTFADSPALEHKKTITPSLLEETRQRQPAIGHRLRRDYLTGGLGAIVLGFALLLGWMVGRSSWHTLSPSTQISTPKRKNSAAQQPATSSPATKAPESTRSTERTPIGSSKKGRTIAGDGEGMENVPPGAIVIYQNGKVIFRMPPAQVEGSGALQQHAEFQPSADQITNRAMKTESASKPKMLEVSPEVAASHLVHRVEPQYPSEAREQRVQGAVVLHLWIGSDGYVGKTKLISGDSRLAEAAIEAVEQWQYQPYYMNGQAVVVQTEITINFTAP